MLNISEVTCGHDILGWTGGSWGCQYGGVMADANFGDKTIWTGDNLDILRGMNSGCVDLIYLDPPFNSNQDYAAPVGSQAAGAAFKDTWTLSDLDTAWMGLIADEQPAVHHVLQAAREAHGKGMQSYLCMMAVRLTEMRRVLKETGSIYLHCDPTASHYLKLLMDAVFGQRNFRNEIVWRYKKYQKANMSHFTRNSDRVIYYFRSPNATYNPVFEKLKTPKRYLKRQWDKGEKRIVNAKDEQGHVQYITVDQEKIDDVWELPYLMPAARERVGYPTQKPLSLLERVITASSNKGDMVLDPFCGCATACVAADKLERQWAGIDISPKAVELVNMRLQQAMGSLFHHGYVTARTDIPRRTDIDAPVPYRQNKHVLFGQQEGLCAGCRGDFPFKLFEVDHVVPRSRGGTDHLGNLQLLCSSCNRIKGDRTQEYLMVRLGEIGG